MIHTTHHRMIVTQDNLVEEEVDMKNNTFGDRIYKLNSTRWTIPGQFPINQGNSSQKMMILEVFRVQTLQLGSALG